MSGPVPTPVPARPAPRSYGRRVVVVVVALVVVVAAVAFLEIRAARATPGVRAGQLWEKGGSLGLDYAHTLTFDLPSGQLVVKLATPVHSVPSYDAPEGLVDPGDDVNSGSEAAFVPIGWTLQGAPASVPGTPQYQFQVSLLDGDHRYDLHAGTSTADPTSATDPVVTSKQMTVVVAGDGGGLVVEVTYDGLTQRGFVGNDDIDPGVAAPYYDNDVQRQFLPSRSCSLFTAAQARRLDTEPFDCSVGAVRLLPYVPGLGWVAGKDDAWAVVEVSVRADSHIIRGRRVYPVTRHPLRAVLDGHRPRATLLATDDGYTRSATYVFASTPTPAAFRLVARFTARPDGAGRPARGRGFTFGTDRLVALR